MNQNGSQFNTQFLFKYASVSVNESELATVDYLLLIFYVQCSMQQVFIPMKEATQMTESEICSQTLLNILNS